MCACDEKVALCVCVCVDVIVCMSERERKRNLSRVENDAGGGEGSVKANSKKNGSCASFG